MSTIFIIIFQYCQNAVFIGKDIFIECFLRTWTYKFYYCKARIASRFFSYQYSIVKKKCWYNLILVHTYLYFLRNLWILLSLIIKTQNMTFMATLYTIQSHTHFITYLTYISFIYTFNTIHTITLTHIHTPLLLNETIFTRMIQHNKLWLGYI